MFKQGGNAMLEEKSERHWAEGAGEEDLIGEHLMRKDSYTQGAIDALELVGVTVREHPNAKGRESVPLDDLYAIIIAIGNSVREDRAYTVLPLKRGYHG